MDDFYGTPMVLNGKPNFTQCARCKQVIKRVFYFRGKPYGGDCIEVVTGKRADYWVVKEDVIDEEATARREQDMERQREENDAKVAEQTAKAKLLAEKAQADNKWLIDVMKTHTGAFCACMVEELSKGPLDEQRFSQRQLSIMVDIYGKHHGRRNSKAYNTAYDDFWSKIPEKEEGK